ncbi:pyridoxamine 5'-phosphate oxidase family protein [Chryseolinea lacunae]|uniref:Pyridoxamine 5'-phosphate oxidase family protein n=1 Tax=Chryseolinea lacunae TaxID=2801331 RepID=A0ABS1KMP2_9BACT|nr:pyridoxamine 5'-phosphate oxidase family protein [Chryseolinea lacunae]MBL0740488.1 pyridoxamine 5'-phosphate oxidase family protein [Chryseolinea lacunae]
MLGTLSKKQCERVLLAGLIGRVGCHAGGKVYIVPLTYVFDGGMIYAHSKEGLKVTMMRKNPNVCFQVDQVDNMTNWRSVVLWGTFEEVKTPAAQDKVLKLLVDRFEAFHTSESVKPVFHTAEHQPLKEKKPVIFRIVVDEMTGRFEKNTSENII